MADGGSGSNDPFRLPDAPQKKENKDNKGKTKKLDKKKAEATEPEMSCPFGNGLVMRYGYSPALVSKAATILGFSAELLPRTQVSCCMLLLLYCCVAGKGLVWWAEEVRRFSSIGPMKHTAFIAPRSCPVAHRCTDTIRLIERPCLLPCTCSSI